MALLTPVDEQKHLFHNGKALQAASKHLTKLLLILCEVGGMDNYP